MQTSNFLSLNSQKSLKEGLDEYYKSNPNLASLANKDTDLGVILIAHDVGHVIYGLDTSIYQELVLLMLFWWTSECTFSRYLALKNSPAVDLMYDDMVKEKGNWWLTYEIIKCLPKLIYNGFLLRFLTLGWGKKLPFLNYHFLLELPLDQIRKEYSLINILELVR
jgi:hypothetical protein